VFRKSEININGFKLLDYHKIFPANVVTSIKNTNNTVKSINYSSFHMKNVEQCIQANNECSESDKQTLQATRNLGKTMNFIIDKGFEVLAVKTDVLDASVNSKISSIKFR